MTEQICVVGSIIGSVMMKSILDILSEDKSASEIAKELILAKMKSTIIVDVYLRQKEEDGILSKIMPDQILLQMIEESFEENITGHNCGNPNCVMDEYNKAKQGIFPEREQEQLDLLQIAVNLAKLKKETNEVLNQKSK